MSSGNTPNSNSTPRMSPLTPNHKQHQQSAQNQQHSNKYCQEPRCKRVYKDATSFKAEIDKMRKELGDCRNDLTNSNVENQQLKDGQRRMQQEIDSHKLEIRNKDQEIRMKTDEIGTKNREIMRKDKEIDRKEQEIEKKDFECEKKDRLIKEAKSEVLESIEAMEQLIRERKSLEEEGERLTRENEQLKNQINNAPSTVPKSKLKSTRTQTEKKTVNHSTSMEDGLPGEGEFFRNASKAISQLIAQSQSRASLDSSPESSVPTQEEVPDETDDEITIIDEKPGTPNTRKRPYPFNHTQRNKILQTAQMTTLCSSILGGSNSPGTSHDQMNTQYTEENPALKVISSFVEYCRDSSGDECLGRIEEFVEKVLAAGSLPNDDDTGRRIRVVLERFVNAALDLKKDQ